MELGKREGKREKLGLAAVSEIRVILVQVSSELVFWRGSELFLRGRVREDRMAGKEGWVDGWWSMW